jgi:hypothetical protein
MTYPRPTTQHCLTAILSLFSLLSTAQVTPALVDFDAYEKLVSEVKQHRQSRLLNAEEFAKASKEKNVIILDTRSDAMYAAVHIKGAIHLNFSDFTQDNLKKIIPSPECRILIYCNNNFVSTPLPASPTTELKDYTRYFATKSFRPEPKALPQQTSGSSFRNTKDTGYPENAKPITLALNIPTYINLYGYGYRNIYELSELVNTYDSKLEFEGTAVDPVHRKPR